MRLFFRYIIIFLIINYKWILVESTGSSATPPASSGGSTNSSNKTGVDLSLKATAATPQFNYNKAGQVVTYTAKDSFGFKSVKTGNKVVWEASNPNEYATKVVLNGKGKKQKEVTIHLPNNTTKVFKRDGKGKDWFEFDSSKPTPVSLNVDSVKDSDYYTFKLDDCVRTFTPKEGYVFNEVHSGGVVWKTTNENEYANKVEYLSLNFVWIYSTNNAEKTFRYAGNNQWVENIDLTQKSTTTDTSGTTGTGTTPASPTSGGGTTGTDGSGGGGTDQSGGGTTGTDKSGGGRGSQGSKPATQ